MYILHLETATKVCSVALSYNGTLVQLEETNDDQYAHGEKLTLYIESCLKKQGIEANELCAISVDKGPGSYTGLRIGLSVAKGMCFALSIPIILMDSLTCLYEGHINSNSKTIIIPMIDARRMEVYTRIFHTEYTTDIEAKVLVENSFSELHSFVVCGDAIDKVKSLWQERKNISYSENPISAQNQIKIAYKKYLNNEFDDLAYCEPIYLKEFGKN